MLLAVLGITFGVAFVRGVMEVAERNLTILCDCLMDAVSVFYYAVVHTANTVGNIGLSVQGRFGFLSSKGFDFLCNFPCLFSGDELGGLDAIDQQPQFVRLKRRV